MTAPVTIRLPWPDKRLSPNARVHFMEKSRVTRLHRNWARDATLEAKAKNLGWAGATVSLLFNPPDRRQRDRDNLVGMTKAFCDGIADATGINDRHFRLQAPVIGDVVPGGQIIVTLEPIEDAA